MQSSNPTRLFKHKTLLCLVVLLSGVVSGATAQDGSLAERLQAVQPKFLQTETLNDRGCEATANACVRPGDEIWLISTRHIETCTDDVNAVEVIKLIENDWFKQDFNSLKLAHDSDQEIQTIFYSHGNMTDLNWSIVRGLEFYENLFLNRPNGPRVRFVIWSWPSQRETIPLVDALVKSRRAKVEGRSMRAALDALDGQRPLVIGYSFGGQVVLSAMQAATSNWNGMPYRVTLIAPALERDYIHCEVDSTAIGESTSEVVAFVNGSDRVIRANSALCRRAYRRSGKCDYCMSSKLTSDVALNEIDLTGESPKKHAIALYGANPKIVGMIQSQVDSLALVFEQTLAVPDSLDSVVVPTDLVVPELLEVVPE